VIADGYLDIREVTASPMKSFEKDSKDQKLRNNMLTDLAKKTSFLKKAEDVKLETSTAGTRGLGIYYDALWV
jgi:hypothetical protein